MLIKLNYTTEDKKRYKTKAEYGDLAISSEDQYGFRPYFLLVSSVVGCTGSRLQKEIEALGLTYEDIKVKADVTRNEEEVMRVEKIHLTFTVRSKEISMEELEEVMKRTYEKSSMFQTVKNSIVITHTLFIDEVNL